MKGKYSKENDMKRILVAFALVGLVVMAAPSVVSAAPNINAAHVAVCATQMGGQSVADCAKTTGIVNCVQMN